MHIYSEIDSSNPSSLYLHSYIFYPTVWFIFTLHRKLFYRISIRFYGFIFITFFLNILYTYNNFVGIDFYFHLSLLNNFWTILQNKFYFRENFTEQLLILLTPLVIFMDWHLKHILCVYLISDFL